MQIAQSPLRIGSYHCIYILTMMFWHVEQAQRESIHHPIPWTPTPQWARYVLEIHKVCPMLIDEQTSHHHGIPGTSARSIRRKPVFSGFKVKAKNCFLLHLPARMAWLILVTSISTSLQREINSGSVMDHRLDSLCGKRLPLEQNKRLSKVLGTFSPWQRTIPFLPSPWLHIKGIMVVIRGNLLGIGLKKNLLM